MRDELAIIELGTEINLTNVYVLTGHFLDSLLAILYSTATVRADWAVGKIAVYVSGGEDLNNSSPSSSPTVLGMLWAVTTVSSYRP